MDIEQYEDLIIRYILEFYYCRLLALVLLLIRKVVNNPKEWRDYQCNVLAGTHYWKFLYVRYHNIVYNRIS